MTIAEFKKHLELMGTPFFDECENSFRVHSLTRFDLELLLKIPTFTHLTAMVEYGAITSIEINFKNQ